MDKLTILSPEPQALLDQATALRYALNEPYDSVGDLESYQAGTSTDYLLMMHAAEDSSDPALAVLEPIPIYLMSDRTRYVDGRYSVDAVIQETNVRHDIGVLMIARYFKKHTTRRNFIGRLIGKVPAHEPEFEKGIEYITRAQHDLAPLVNGEKAAVFINSLPHGTPRRGYDAMSTAFGNKVGSITRLRTALFVMEGADIHGSRLKDKEYAFSQQGYGVARRYLKDGNDGYSRVDLDMAGARQARANRDNKQILPWLGRAAYGLAWTAMHDNENLGRACQTTVRQLLQLRSVKASKLSFMGEADHILRDQLYSYERQIESLYMRGIIKAKQEEPKLKLVPSKP